MRIQDNGSDNVVSGLTDEKHVSIDLRLASSYIPGILSICKVVVLLASMNIMQKLGVHLEQAIVVCAACGVFIDRVRGAPFSHAVCTDTGDSSFCDELLLCDLWFYEP